jgi:hypothetical protein
LTFNTGTGNVPLIPMHALKVSLICFPLGFVAVKQRYEASNPFIPMWLCDFVAASSTACAFDCIVHWQTSLFPCLLRDLISYVMHHVSLFVLLSVLLLVLRPYAATARSSHRDVDVATAAPVFDVTTYGAVGDGVTDCTAAVGKAVAALQSSTPGGTLYFPHGEYLLADEPTSVSASSKSSAYIVLRLASASVAVSVQGDGSALSTIFWNTTTGVHLFDVSGPQSEHGHSKGGEQQQHQGGSFALRGITLQTLHNDGDPAGVQLVQAAQLNSASLNDVQALFQQGPWRQHKRTTDSVANSSAAFSHKCSLNLLIDLRLILTCSQS